MSLIKRTILQIQQLRFSFLLTYTVIMGIVSVFAGVAAHYDISFAYFSRDPAITLYGHPFTGALSHVGILLWCASVAICWFTAAVLRKGGETGLGRFMLYSGLLTALLMLDDLFMFHEYVFPLSFAIPQNAVYGAYLLLMLIYVVRFARTLLTLEYSVFVVACGWLGLSLLTDMLFAQSEIEFLLEDGFKLLGIATWLMFFARSAYRATLEISAPSPGDY